MQFVKATKGELPAIAIGSESAHAVDLPRLCVLAILAICALSLAYPLASLAGWMMGREYYQHFPLLLITAIVLATMRLRNNPVSFEGRLSFRVLAWLSLALVLTVAVYTVPSRWFASLAGVALLFATVNFYGGRRLAALMLGPIMLVAAAVPLPVNFDNWFVVSLQQLATWMASVWLDLANIMHFTTGVSIDTPGQGYYVKDACSGIHSVFAAVAVGVGYGVFRHYTVVRMLLFVLQLLFWVVVANALRVFLTVYGEARFDWDLSAAAYHELLGIATFVTGVLLSISGDHMIRYLFPQKSVGAVPTGNAVAFPVVERKLLDGPLSSTLVVSVATVLLVGGLGVGLTYFSYRTPVASAMSIEQMAQLSYVDLGNLKEDLLPTEINGWRQSGFQVEERDDDSIFGGMVSAVWQYGNGERRVLVSLDGPYDDWHDLAVCYSGTGWSISDIATFDNGEAEPLYSCRLEIDRKPIDRAEVLYACIAPNGDDVKPPAFFGGALMSLVRRFGIGMQDRPGFKGGVIQVQLMDQTVGDFSNEQKKENEELFWKIVEEVKKKGKRS